MQKGQAILVMLIGVATILLTLIGPLFGGMSSNPIYSIGTLLWLGVGLVEIIVGSFLLDESKKG